MVAIILFHIKVKAWFVHVAITKALHWLCCFLSSRVLPVLELPGSWATGVNSQHLAVSHFLCSSGRACPPHPSCVCIRGPSQVTPTHLLVPVLRNYSQCSESLLTVSCEFDVSSSYSSDPRSTLLLFSFRCLDKHLILRLVSTTNQFPVPNNKHVYWYQHFPVSGTST